MPLERMPRPQSPRHPERRSSTVVAADDELFQHPRRAVEQLVDEHGLIGVHHHEPCGSDPGGITWAKRIPSEKLPGEACPAPPARAPMLAAHDH